MQANKTSKPFMSYEEQLALLKSKFLDIIDETYTMNLLKRYSYFALISGYKNPFKSKKSDKYKFGTSIDDIFSLYQFDFRLRALFLKNILIVETHIKSLISYSFCELHGDKQETYLDKLNYRHTEYELQVNKLIIKLEKALNESSQYSYLRHQKAHYGNIPLWALINALTLGVISSMYRLLPQPLQSKISKEFQEINEGNLASMLDILARVRNVCAHNERLFDYKYQRGSIGDTQVHAKLNIPKKNNFYTKGKQDVFSVVVVLKYLLCADDFILFCKELTEILSTFHASTSIIEVEQLQRYLGFPENWQDILKI